MSMRRSAPLPLSTVLIDIRSVGRLRWEQLHNGFPLVSSESAFRRNVLGASQPGSCMAEPDIHLRPLGTNPSPMIELWVQPAGPETISEGLGSPMLRVPSRRIGKARQVTLR